MPSSADYDSLYLVLFADRQFVSSEADLSRAGLQGNQGNQSSGRLAGELALLCFGWN